MVIPFAVLVFGGLLTTAVTLASNRPHRSAQWWGMMVFGLALAVWAQLVGIGAGPSDWHASIASPLAFLTASACLPLLAFRSPSLQAASFALMVAGIVGSLLVAGWSIAAAFYSIAGGCALAQVARSWQRVVVFSGRWPATPVGIAGPLGPLLGGLLLTILLVLVVQPLDDARYFHRLTPRAETVPAFDAHRMVFPLLVLAAIVAATGQMPGETNRRWKQRPGTFAPSVLIGPWALLFPMRLDPSLTTPHLLTGALVLGTGLWTTLNRRDNASRALGWMIAVGGVCLLLTQWRPIDGEAIAIAFVGLVGLPLLVGPALGADARADQRSLTNPPAAKASQQRDIPMSPWMDSLRLWTRAPLANNLAPTPTETPSPTSTLELRGFAPVWALTTHTGNTDAGLSTPPPTVGEPRTINPDEQGPL